MTAGTGTHMSVFRSDVQEQAVERRDINVRRNVPDCDLEVSLPQDLDNIAAFQIINAIEDGDPQAAEEQLPLVYEEPRRLAAQKMASERTENTLQPTALVHEAWIKLAGSNRQAWNGRSHYFGAAAVAMRRILIDRARKRNRLP